MACSSEKTNSEAMETSPAAGTDDVSGSPSSPALTPEPIAQPTSATNPTTSSTVHTIPPPGSGTNPSQSMPPGPVSANPEPLGPQPPPTLEPSAPDTASVPLGPADSATQAPAASSAPSPDSTSVGGAPAEDSSAPAPDASATGTAPPPEGTANPIEGHYTGPSGAVPDLKFSGLTTAVELAPLRLAVSEYYPNISLGSGGVDNLCNGQADIATNAETQLLRSTVDNPNCHERIIFTVCEGLYRMVAKKSQVSSLADLAGKRIAVADGTSADYFVFKLFYDAGLATNYTAAGSPSGSSFNDTTISAAAEWEPKIDDAAQALGDDLIEFQKNDAGEYVYRELFDLHATEETLANADKRKGIVELVRAMIQTSWEIRQDPSVAWDVMKGPTGISNEDAYLRSMKYERFAGTLVTDTLDVLEAEETTWHAPLRSTPRTARTREQLAEYIDTSVLEEALSGM